MRLPKQAVILCGGLGTRLRPITNTLPKPLVPVNGRPFLVYLIQQLREQGIDRFVLLTGYRGEQIHSALGDGTTLGVHITYSHGPVEWETARRISEARAQLDPVFLLLYSDNFVPFNLAKLAAFHASRAATISLTVQPKARANIALAGDGRVSRYDSTRSTDGLTHVEIGYMLVERDAMLAAVRDRDASFAMTLRDLADRGFLAGLETLDPYHSISDVERWQLTERYLAPKRLLLIDRDGTINRRPPRGTYVANWRDFAWIEENVTAMHDLAAAGFRFIVLSNQAGIARGMVSAADVDDVNGRMQDELAVQGIDVAAVYVCPHHWDDGCACRKPAPGMFFRAAKEHLVRLDRTVYIGDDPRDSEAASNAGCLSALVGPERLGPMPAPPSCAGETLAEVAPWILDTFQSWEAAELAAVAVP